MTPDNELLRRYTEQGDETAFTELVKRHLNLVYACAMRGLNNDAALAQDVAQAVFTDLARKAAQLRNHPTLAGWLHTSARFAASKVVRAEQTRRTHEQEAASMNETLTTPADSTWSQLHPVLDEAIGDLRETDRDALLLRYFEEKSHREIGEVLGVSEGAAHMRVERALEKLRAQFIRRGVTTTATLLASVLGAHGAAVTAPQTLAETLSAKSLSEIAAAGLVASAPNWYSKTRLSFIAVALIIIGALALFLFTPAKPAEQPPTPTLIMAQPPGGQPPAAVKVEAPKAPAAPAIAAATEAPPPAFHDLGEIKFTATSAPQSFPLKSGLVFTIRQSAFNANGTITLRYGVHDPKKSNARGAFHLAGRRPDDHNALALEIDYTPSIMSGATVQERLFNGETVKFTPIAPKLDANDLGEIYYTPGKPLKYVLNSGKILVVVITPEGGNRISIIEKVYKSEEDYLSGNSSQGGQGSGELDHLHQYHITPLEIVSYTLKQN